MDRRARRNAKFLATGLLAATGGALAAVSRARSAAREIPTNHLGGKQRRWRWNENEIFVTELGSGPPVLLIHGIHAGASSFEYRKLAPLLAVSHRVIAFDFLGCGLSDRPDAPYSADLFVAQILAVLDELVDEPVTVIAASLGAAFAIRAALRNEERVRSLIVIQPTGLEHQEEVAGVLRGASEALLRAPYLGEGVFSTLTAQASLRRYLLRAYSRPEFISEDVLAHYAATTRVPGARFVTAAFVGGALGCDIASDLPFLTLPVLILWGAKAAIGPGIVKAEEYATLGNTVTVRMYPESGALPHEEDPSTVADDIEQFLRSGEAQVRALSEV